MMKKKTALVLAGILVLGFTLSGCGDGSGRGTKSDAELVYAVEAGSAGEEAAKAKSVLYNSVDSQADALMEVASGTSDAAIIDLLMAGAMVGEGKSYPDMICTDELTTEKYGVGCRKGSDLASYINAVFYESYSDGSMEALAEKYGLQEALLAQKEAEYTPGADSDVAYIQDKGTLIVGITDFAPMDYQDGSGEWVGFDADMARKVAQKLGVEVQFVEIEWDAKAMELEEKNLDVVWNGMSLTGEVLEAMECTNPYCKNAQVVVAPAK
ncbi:MAG: transporter substrate-binding domain-containing protein [Muribaculaceae bacterium]|nr:transporter substrate-binding domain-containing protein [Roseburia sp.]MCM1431579.1 transporter substrate-binding domain-containing protein [Muribaculaceae bacterium]MCM1492044.1 transporter substrate-binding domain-containing protein [Muribaculaceae bacterium]